MEEAKHETRKGYKRFNKAKGNATYRATNLRLGIMELYQYSGEPTDEEIEHRLRDRIKDGVNHLSIRHICPNCQGNNTEWIRNEWSICFGCQIAFNPFDQVYDTQAYKEDDRIEDEVLKEVYNESM